MEKRKRDFCFLDWSDRGKRRSTDVIFASSRRICTLRLLTTMSADETTEQEDRTTLEPPESPDAPSVPQPVQVLYCAGKSNPLISPTYWSSTEQNHQSVCSYPPEYCEFGEHLTRCKEWLKDSHPDLYDTYYSEGA